MINITHSGDVMTVKFATDIDHHSCVKIRQEIDTAIETNQPKEIRLDFEQVMFMDSSGIGLVMGRYKLAKSIGAQVYVCNTSQRLKKVMMLSGMDRLVKFVNEGE